MMVILIETVQQSICINGEVRLVNGSGPHEGRVEVCINKAWGTICRSSWNENDIHVACRQLGHAGLGTVYNYKFNL